jgi:hypothetical protein
MRAAMIKEIQYAGYATEPSDYECPDGQLATSLNLISEDNQLKPVFQPKPLCEMPDGARVVHIHATVSYVHYIVRHNDKLQWFDGNIIGKWQENDGETRLPVKEEVITAELERTNPSHTLHDFSGTEIYDITAIGNTLVVLTDGGMHYFLWKGTADGYKHLGTHMPECPLAFGLQGEVVKTENFSVTVNDTSSTELDDANKKTMTERVLAKVNKFIAENSTNAGRFIFPFFVRYAYRLYDGSLVMHSSPVLMPCCTDGAPLAPFRGWVKGDGKYKAVNDIAIIAVRHQLDYAAQLEARIDMLKEWKDIIHSVDIFISKPIYTYNQNGEIKDIAAHGVGAGTVCKHVNQHASFSKKTFPLKYRYRDFADLFRYTFPDEDRPFNLGLGIPYKSREQIDADMRSCAQFYMLKSIKVEDLKTTRTIIPIEEGYLKSLVNREVMTDDYDSHDRLIPEYAFAYNSRLNISNIRKKLYDTFNTADMVCYSDADISNDGISVPNHRYRLFFFIKQDDREIIVEGESAELSSDAPFFYLYYPNPNAYKAVVNDITASEYWEYMLERHAFLNGAYCFRGFFPFYKKKLVDIVTESTDKIVNVPSKIYTSQVNNPFHFPVLGINTVGTGKILAISAAAKALSQGQFGQFPLYAFTTEGVWALEVSSTGTYSARQPVTRDVCINADSITQLDSSVLFATDRGIMLISGSQTQCITDSIFAERPFDVTTLPGMDKLHAMLGTGHDADACVPVLPFLGFLEHCQMVYDYVHQRIFVFNPTQVTENGVAKAKYNYAYVYSLKSQRWGMIYSNLADTINAYPHALAMTQDNKLVSFSGTAGDESKGLYVTRPLKLEAADVHKTISALIQRGHFQRGDVATVLYGSRDLRNWQLVWSGKDQYLRGFRGTPYKYFRIAGVAKLTDGKSIFGASVNFEPRHNNQLR